MDMVQKDKQRVDFLILGGRAGRVRGSCCHFAKSQACLKSPMNSGQG